MKTLPRSGFQLGWVRVAVRIAATNKPPTAARVREMAEAIPSVSSLTYETGLLPKSGFREPGDSSQVLGFSEKARCTDLGHALGLAERWSHADDPFTHSPAVRWVLWYSSGTTAATFWRAAFEALPAVDDPVKWFLATRNLLGSRGQISSLELDDFNYHGQPWLGQAKNLGWSFNALQSLRQWVGQSSDPWTHGDIWRAFQIAEGLSSRPATPDDLRALLLDLPPELLGFDRQEATVSTVQLCGVARGLAAGELQDWYGEPWRALMRDASALGVYEKAGAQALSPNLAWDTERLKPTAAPPSPPPGLPPLPEALPPATLAPVLAEADQRARSWMRAMAWWARGPHAADILLHGHDSWRLLHSTLEHWLQPAEKDRWQGRTAHVHTVPWLKKTVNRFAAVVPGHACRVLVDDTVDHETRALAFRKVPREIEFPALVGTWLDDGEGHWAEVEQASVVWAAHCVERHLCRATTWWQG
jgi:hypothetical protein